MCKIKRCNLFLIVHSFFVFEGSDQSTCLGEIVLLTFKLNMGCW